MNENKKSAYERLTPQRRKLMDQVMANLESGAGIWKQGWKSGGAPVSAITGKKYNGYNRFSLMQAMMEHGYTDNRWLTYNQMTERGWSFKTDEEGNSLGKGAGVAIEYCEFRDKLTKQPFDRHTLDGMTKEEQNEYMEENVYMLRKYYHVFNGSIIEGIPERGKKALDPNGLNARAENILQVWSDSEAKIYYGGDRAYYNSEKDEVHLPEREDFVNLQEFYSTALHEIGHSTGHVTRLNRNLGSTFGTPEYAVEELRAEIASMFLEQDLDIELGEEHIGNNSAYIQAWKEKLKEDPNVLFKAIADAEKISKFIMAKERAAAEENAEESSEEIIEEKSEIFLPPSEVAAKTSEGTAVIGTIAAAETTGRGLESLTRMEDREIVERAGKTRHGDKFLALFHGESKLGSEEKDERSLMARLAMFTGANEGQLLRIFRASGQYRDDKPNSYYEKMAREEIKFVSGIRAEKPRAVQSGNTNGGRFANAK
ncbi:MAG: zincin-like metallopeptidase domain-containing protein [Lachnospiraceae bacterium]|nr:zincin-like metallopeptidase domain-containing protein [Lachnospiraceae bacterium]